MSEMDETLRLTVLSIDQIVAARRTPVADEKDFDVRRVTRRGQCIDQVLYLVEILIGQLKGNDREVPLLDPFQARVNFEFVHLK